MRFSASLAAGAFRLSAMPRLLRFIAMNAADSPATEGRLIARVSSPPGTRSTLTTSAPRSASIMPQVGPAMICASSRTFTPASGPLIRSPADPADRAEADPGNVGHEQRNQYQYHGERPADHE